jgi:hypothetical protein
MIRRVASHRPRGGLAHRLSSILASARARA